jgi:hypothetical protein
VNDKEQKVIDAATRLNELWEDDEALQLDIEMQELALSIAVSELQGTGVMAPPQTLAERVSIPLYEIEVRQHHDGSWYAFERDVPGVTPGATKEKAILTLFDFLSKQIQSTGSERTDLWPDDGAAAEMMEQLRLACAKAAGLSVWPPETTPSPS